MRPYQITPGGEWIDLDTIQSIVPPEFDEMCGPADFVGAVMYVRQAFQDKPRRMEFIERRDAEWNYARSEDGTPAVLARMRRELFDPLLKAWTNQT